MLNYMSCKACKQSKQHSLTCSMISLRAKYSCNQLVPPIEHVLLAIIKLYLSHMYVLFVYKVKLKGSTMQKLMTSTTKE